MQSSWRVEFGVELELSGALELSWAGPLQSAELLVVGVRWSLEPGVQASLQWSAELLVGGGGSEVASQREIASRRHNGPK